MPHYHYLIVGGGMTADAASIALREEVESNVSGHLGHRYGAEEGQPSRCNTTLS